MHSSSSDEEEVHALHAAAHYCSLEKEVALHEPVRWSSEEEGLEHVLHESVHWSSEAEASVAL